MTSEYLKKLVPAYSLTFVELNCLESSEFETLLCRFPVERRLFRRHFAWIALKRAMQFLIRQSRVEKQLARGSEGGEGANKKAGSGGGGDTVIDREKLERHARLFFGFSRVSDDEQPLEQAELELRAVRGEASKLFRQFRDGSFDVDENEKNHGASSFEARKGASAISEEGDGGAEASRQGNESLNSAVDEGDSRGVRVALRSAEAAEAWRRDRKALEGRVDALEELLLKGLREGKAQREAFKKGVQDLQDRHAEEPLGLPLLLLLLIAPRPPRCRLLPLELPA